MTYPGNNTAGSGEAVTYGYYRQMVLSDIDGYSPYVPDAGASYDAPGRLQRLKLGGTAGTPKVDIDYQYYDWNNPTSLGRLSRILTTGTQTLQDLRYTYDEAGNVLTIEDYVAGVAPSPQTQTFTYDALNRLTSAQASGGAGGSGDYPLESYTYSTSTGNLTAKAGVSYAYNDTAHRHAVTTLAGVRRYWYDANGNQTKRYIGSDTYDLEYDHENRLRLVKKNGSKVAEFWYDADGNRVKSEIGGVFTCFVGNYFEWSGSPSTMKKYYYASGQRIAMRTGSGSGDTGLLWLLTDHLGSTSASANPSGSRGIISPR
jgi:YD repeat-containing protein